MTDELGDRMKLYERATDARLMRRLPVIARLDGRSFSKFTAKAEKPFSSLFEGIMDELLCMKLLKLRLRCKS